MEKMEIDTYVMFVIPRALGITGSDAEHTKIVAVPELQGNTLLVLYTMYAQLKIIVLQNFATMETGKLLK